MNNVTISNWAVRIMQKNKKKEKCELTLKRHKNENRGKNWEVNETTDE